MNNSYTVHNSFELVADPVQFPITVGNEHFLVIQQDRRNITDRRSWTVVPILSSLDNPLQQISNQCNQIPPSQLLQQLLSLVTIYCNQIIPNVRLPVHASTEPFKFHYEKQTSTDDLEYFMRQNCWNTFGHGEPQATKHVRFIVEPTFVDKCVNTDKGEHPMECDPGEGTSGGVQLNYGCDNAYNLMKHKKEQKGWF